ncbi:MAG TPA: SpoIID/LytB domain-containing protein [Acidimicrobiales bacterium]|nr:SpoIID/LytB domain-containing protein [Acidimicrobiales bacterium]
MRSRVSKGVLAGAAAVLAVPALEAAGPAGAAGGVAVVSVSGRGFGHGVGLSQDGSLSMGRAGAGTRQILGQFYPGTSLGSDGGPVRVQVLSAPNGDTTIQLPNGGQIQDAVSGSQSPGFPLKVPPGGGADLRYAGGRYTATVLGGGVSAQALGPAVTLPPPTLPTTSSTTTSTTGPNRSPLPTTPGAGGVPGSTTTTTSPSGSTRPGGGGGPANTASTSRPLWAVPAGDSVVGLVATGRRYRGLVQARGDGSALDLVNQLDVEQYLRGMGEVQDPSWPLTSMQAQVIVERTYALRGMAAAGEICDDDRCQVYIGQTAEYPAQDHAVATTTGYVLTYGGGLAATVFSANGGGYEASPQEGFGASAGSYPYLRAAPYYTTNPDPWNLTLALADIGSRLGYPGTLTSVAVSSVGPSGRALTVTMQGSAGPEITSGIGFAASLGLRSNLFTLHDTVAASAPPPPPPAENLQALPTDSSALRESVSAAQQVGPTHRRAGVLTRPGPPGGSPLRWAGLVVLVLLAASGVAWRRGWGPRRTRRA